MKEKMRDMDILYHIGIGKFNFDLLNEKIENSNVYHSLETD